MNLSHQLLFPCEINKKKQATKKDIQFITLVTDSAKLSVTVGILSEVFCSTLSVMLLNVVGKILGTFYDALKFNTSANCSLINLHVLKSTPL